MRGPYSYAVKSKLSISSYEDRKIITDNIRNTWLPRYVKIFWQDDRNRIFDLLRKGFDLRLCVKIRSPLLSNELMAHSLNCKEAILTI